MRASGPKKGAADAGPDGPNAAEPREPVAAPAPGAGKPAWRAWARGVRRAWAAAPGRRAADESTLRAWLAAWAPWREARLVLVYVAFGDELDPVEAGWRAGDAPGPALATTRTVGPGKPLEVRAWREPFERHPFGFLQPPPDAPAVDLEAIDLVLVPGLAFDLHGGRLGHGQGHYDRLLPRLPGRVPRVGVTLDALVVDRLPTAPHDAPMSHLLTPSGMRTARTR
ncbi:MAG: 5-formyltetrahydrofolate cyclo-ligase [Trueperaceae bacterium]|nr:5-formyltetrahydrofolate cyclo-ligase [Trueperaceae bacterium]